MVGNDGLEHADAEDLAVEEERPKVGKKTAIDAGRGPTSFAVDPWTPLIVGSDEVGGIIHKQGEHRLWQPRCKKPLNEARVQNMMERGFTSIVDVQKEGPYVLVVDGRGRTRDAREADRRLREKGRGGLKVICQVKRGTDLDMVMHMASANALRDDYTALDQAFDAQAVINYGGTDEQAANAIGKTVAYTKKVLTLHDLDPKVQQAIRDNVISAFAGFELTALTRDEQLVQLERIKAGEYQPTAKNIDGVVKAIRTGGAVNVAPPRGSLRKLYQHKEAKRVLGPERYAMLKWFLGESQLPGGIGGLKGLWDEVSAPKKKAEVAE